MMRSMFAAISGLKNHQTMMDVAANDIANVNTLGYKGSRTTFKDSLNQLTRGGTAQTANQGGANPIQVGLGVQLSSIDSQMSSGALQGDFGSRWASSGASGVEQVGTPGGNYGTTTSGTIEMSNVDLAFEFTTMITAQRGFQANSRVISSADEMLQDLVNLKR